MESGRRESIIVGMDGDKESPLGFIRRYLGSLRAPQLFVAMAALFLLDLFVPDPIPLLDEAFLAAATLLLGMWRDRQPPAGRDEPRVKNVTPPGG